MPSPEQERRARTEELFKEFNGKNVKRIDLILHRARGKWPYLNDRTLKGLAKSVWRMLEAKKEE